MLETGYAEDLVDWYDFEEQLENDIDTNQDYLNDIKSISISKVIDLFLDKVKDKASASLANTMTAL